MRVVIEVVGADPDLNKACELAEKVRQEMGGIWVGTQAFNHSGSYGGRDESTLLLDIPAVPNNRLWL